MKASTFNKHFRHVASSTLTGKPIFGGAFFVHDTVGLPLGMQILRAVEMGITISVPLFVEDARKAGWGDRTIAKTIKQELRDSGLYADVRPIMAALRLTA